MLILPPGHHREVAQRGRLAGRERRIVGGVAVLCAVLVVAVLIALTGAGSSTYKKGCINVSFASTLGGQQITLCGSDARYACAQLGHPSGYTGNLGRLFAEQCRKFRYPIG